MRKVMLVGFACVLSIFASAQHIETTLKVVGNKARIVVKAVGGDVTGSPTGTTFCVAIPIANASASLATPTVANGGILDASRLPTLLLAATTQDATYKYYILLFTGGNTSVTFSNGTEYELIQLGWDGPIQLGVLSLISLPNGNIGGGNVVQEGQWVNYIEIGGAQLSPGTQLFYSSSTATVASQMAADDYSAGTGLLNTNATITLPVNLLNFSGYKNGNRNTLQWTTASETNDLGFEVLRSTDGVSYSSIGFVNSTAPGGTSASAISYTFDDNNPVGKKQYYQLRQKDIDGRSRLSNIITINGDKPTSLGIGGLYPNPARSTVNVMIDAPQRDDITVLITDMSGKTVKQKQANVDIGSNTIPVEIGSLSSGSYLVKLVCRSSDCQTATAKFNKQ
jgi:hypothetical protein